MIHEVFSKTDILILITLLWVCGCHDRGTSPVTVVVPEPTLVTPEPLGLSGRLVTRLVYEKPYLYAVAAAHGLWRRDLAAMTDWEYSGLADTTLGNYSNVGVLDLDVLGSELLVSYNGSAPGKDPKTLVSLWRSNDAGKTWIRSDSGIVDSLMYPYETVISACRRSPDRPDLAIARFADATYRSTDGGRNWTLLSGRRGAIGGDDHLRWHPFRAGEYCAWGSTSVFAPYLFAETEYGLTTKFIVDFRALGFGSDDPVSDVAFDCGNMNVIHAATARGLITSTDGGYSWTLGKAAIPGDGFITCLVEHGLKPGVLFLAGGSSLFYSLDGGNTILMLAEVPVRFIESLTIDTEGERLFLGSSAGVYTVRFSFASRAARPAPNRRAPDARSFE
jgi:hypothetical protein